VTKIHSILIGLIVVVFFLDTGGPFGIRIYALTLCLAIGFFSMIKQYSVRDTFFNSKSLLGFSYLFTLFIVYGFTSAALNDVFFSSYIWLVPLLFFFIFTLFFSIFTSEKIIRGYVLSGVIFSIVILTVFFTALLLPKGASQLFLLNFSSIPGWFYLKENGLFPGYPNIYFQATLGLVPVAIMAYNFGYKKSFLLMLFAMAFSLSRFGVFISVSFVVYGYLVSLFKVSQKKQFDFVYSLSFLIGCFVFVSFVVFYFSQDGNYTHSFGSMNIRRGHILSIFDSVNLFNFVFGAGPGSFFYSLGFDAIVNNVEVSQLEVFRKYGLIGYLILHFSFHQFVKFLMLNNSLDLAYIFLSFYLVCLSNPILLTFNLSLLLAVLTIISLNRRRMTKIQLKS
tara:strand:+ start:10715 stop:11896 length:1182 start_codon:yes stop_codon:yes gene_type:complete